MRKQSKTRNSFTTSHRQTGVQPSPGKQGSITHNDYLGRQNAVTPNVPPFLLLPPALCAEHDAIWSGISLWPVGVSCPGCVPSQLLVPPPAYSLVGWGEKQKRPGLCVSTAQHSLKHPCVTNSVSSTNPKHSPIPATLKKITSVPAKASTENQHL